MGCKSQNYASQWLKKAIYCETQSLCCTKVYCEIPFCLFYSEAEMSFNANQPNFNGKEVFVQHENNKLL